MKCNKHAWLGPTLTTLAMGFAKESILLNNRESPAAPQGLLSQGMHSTSQHQSRPAAPATLLPEQPQPPG